MIFGPGLPGPQGVAGATGPQGAQGPAGTGAIKQVVEANTSTAVTVASITYTDIGLSATITPSSAANKVLITISIQCSYARNPSAAHGVGIKVLRGATTIYASPQASPDGPFGDYVSATGATAVEGRTLITLSFLDSPGATSATTYKVQGACWRTTNAGTCTFQSAHTTQNGASYMVLQEVTA